MEEIKMAKLTNAEFIAAIKELSLLPNRKCAGHE